jgi:hypothetical protein
MRMGSGKRSERPAARDGGRRGRRRHTASSRQCDEFKVGDGRCQFCFPLPHCISQADCRNKSERRCVIAALNVGEGLSSMGATGAKHGCCCSPWLRRRDRGTWKSRAAPRTLPRPMSRMHECAISLSKLQMNRSSVERYRNED